MTTPRHCTSSLAPSCPSLGNPLGPYSGWEASSGAKKRQQEAQADPQAPRPAARLRVNFRPGTGLLQRQLLARLRKLAPSGRLHASFGLTRWSTAAQADEEYPPLSPIHRDAVAPQGVGRPLLQRVAGDRRPGHGAEFVPRWVTM